MSRKEEWRAAPGFPDYEVSSVGRVRRVTPGKNTKPGLIVRPSTHPGGYVQYRLPPEPGKKKSVTAHALVAAAFIGPRPAGLEVLHEDDNKSNNYFKNLRYGTGKENSADAKRNGRRPHGERHGNCKYSDEQLRTALVDASRLGVPVAAEKHGLDPIYLYRVRSGDRRSVSI